MHVCDNTAAHAKQFFIREKKENGKCTFIDYRHWQLKGNQNTNTKQRENNNKT